MANFTDFFFGSNIAVWEEAIGEVFGTIEDARQAALAAIYLSTAAISDLNDHYAVLTGGKLDTSWQLEVFREHLQETLQAFFMMSATSQGISQVVAATTMIPPILRDIRLLSRWLLGFQYLPNRFFKRMDGFVCATVDGPYEITDDNNVLIITVDGNFPQKVNLPEGDSITEQQIIDSINEQLVGATATLFGKRFCIDTQRTDASGSILIEAASTSDTLFGLDNFTRHNAPAPSGLLGSQPFGWRLEAPKGSTSTPANINDAIFGVGPAVIRSTLDSPYPGLATNRLLSNGGFENDFAEWDRTDGPDFFISTSRSRSGAKSLAIRTRQILVGNELVNIENTLSTARKFLAGSCNVQVTGFHQAITEGSVFTSSDTPPSVFTWLTSNAVFGYGDKQESVDPIIANPNQPTVKLNDTTVDFVSTGIKVGMVIHIDDGTRLFDGIVVGVATHDLFVDFWRNGPTGTPANPHITGGGFASGVQYTTKALVDNSKNFVTLGVQTGATSSLQDKIRVDISIDEFGVILGRQIVHDIIGVQSNVILVGDWGGSPTPFGERPYFIYRRPTNGTKYRIFNSLTAVPTAVGQNPPLAVSAEFEYQFQFFDDNSNEIGLITTGPIIPTPSLNYTPFSLTAPSPPNTKSVQLFLIVRPDEAGAGALATIDDISWGCQEDVFTELDVANDVRMQKIPFINEASVASGVITYTAYPRDTDKITVSDKTYEFDTGSRSSGVLTYTGQPSDGDTFQLASTVFEFDNDCVVTSGRVQVFIGATDDATFQNLRDAVTGFLGSLVDVVQDTTTNTLTFKSKVFGPFGDTIQFQENSTAISINPAGGFLTGGTAPSVTAGNTPIPIENIDSSTLIAPETLDQPYLQLTSEINSQSAGVKATINTDANVIVIKALDDGLAGNEIPFSSSVTAPPAFTLSPSGGFLSGGTSLSAAGDVIYSGQPSDGDVLVIGSVGYEFDNNNSGTCGNAIPVFIHPSGLGFTYSGLVTAVNARGEAIATLDVFNNKILFTAPTSGPSGNSIPFREDVAVFTINPDNGDKTAQTATGTGNNSRSYSAALVTYDATATAPTVDSVGTFQTVSGVNSATVNLTTNVPAGNRVIVCAGTVSTTGDPTPPVCTDSQGGTYNLDASVVSGVNGRVYVYSLQAGQDLVAGSDFITLSLSGVNTFSGVAVSALSAFGICGKDKSAINDGSGTSFTVGPTSTLDMSGELILGAFSVLSPATDTFTPGAGFTLIGRTGTNPAPGQVTINPEIKTITSGHLTGAVSPTFVNPDAPTCLEVASYLNARLSGITAFCEIISGVFDHGRLGLRSQFSGVNSCLVIGHGSSNRILGFADDKGVCNELKSRRPAWEIAAGGSGVVTLIARAVPPANKFFGTDWHLRFWTKAFHPSGISVSGLTVSGIMGYVSLRFDSGIFQTSTPISITESPTVVELIDTDPGVRFQTVEARMTFSGVTSGVRVVASEPYLINETSKSLHLSSNTIPRNKQREYKLHRLTLANPDSFTQIEAGLVGVIDDVSEELISLTGTDFVDLDNENIFTNSEIVATVGLQATGTINYSVNPNNGDTITLGDDVYEFDNDFVIGTNNIQVVIGPDPDITFQNFVEQVLSNSETCVASIDTEFNIITVKASTAGVAGNDLVFTTTASTLALAPLISTLTGGVDPIVFVRGVDYIIRNDTGQISRTGNSAISDPSPADLAISYSFFPGGVEQASSYPQTIKPVGEKLEPDVTANFFFFGRNQDFISITGINDNFVVVPRTPSRFSYLKPIERGKYSQVVVFSGVGFSAPLNFKADITKPAILIENGIPVPNTATGWLFQNDKTIVIAASEVDPTATYEFEYFLKFQYTTPPIVIPEPGNSYVLLPYSYKVRNADEIKEDVQKVLALDENRQATLSVPAITDQTLATMTKTVSGDTTEVNDEFWQFIDETTVEVFVGAFDESATFTLTYKSRRIEFNTPVDERWEYSTGSGVTFGSFVPFIPGDKVRLSSLTKFRVTTSGDFDVDDYRVRSVAGILDTTELSSCGFGIEPFGKLPFGGCGLEVFEDSAIQNVPLKGTIYLSGNLTAVSQGPQTVGVLMMHPPGNAGVGVSTGTPFLSLGSSSTGSTTLAAAQSRLPVKIIITDMFVTLRTALAGGGTLSVKLNVGDAVGSGSSASAPGVTINSGGTSGNFTSQAFTVNQDQFLAFECLFTGGTTAATVKAISFAYILP